LHDEKPTIIELIGSIKKLNKTTINVGKERGRGISISKWLRVQITTKKCYMF
jgi:hypothetical protein